MKQNSRQKHYMGRKLLYIAIGYRGAVADQSRESM